MPNLKPGQDILDVGCGPGGAAFYLVQVCGDGKDLGYMREKRGRRERKGGERRQEGEKGERRERDVKGRRRAGDLRQKGEDGRLRGEERD